MPKRKSLKKMRGGADALTEDQIKGISVRGNINPIHLNKSGELVVEVDNEPNNPSDYIKKGHYVKTSKNPVRWENIIEVSDDIKSKLKPSNIVLSGVTTPRSSISSADSDILSRNSSLSDDSDISSTLGTPREFTPPPRSKSDLNRIFALEGSTRAAQERADQAEKEVRELESAFSNDIQTP